MPNTAPTLPRQSSTRIGPGSRWTQDALHRATREATVSSGRDGNDTAGKFLSRPTSQTQQCPAAVADADAEPARPRFDMTTRHNRAMGASQQGIFGEMSTIALRCRRPQNTLPGSYRSTVDDDAAGWSQRSVKRRHRPQRQLSADDVCEFSDRQFGHGSPLRVIGRLQFHSQPRRNGRMTVLWRVARLGREPWSQRRAVSRSSKRNCWLPSVWKASSPLPAITTVSPGWASPSAQ